MNRWIIKLLLLVILSRFETVGLPDTIDDAVNYLKSSAPMLHPRIQLGLTDESKRQAARSLFNKQVEALTLLKQSKNTSLIPLLIPFLDYCVSPVPLNGGQAGPSSFTFTLEELCDALPALAAIVNKPGANEALAEYAKNTKNPLDYRMASFHVLRYLDRKRFDEVAGVLNKEFANKKQFLRNYLKSIWKEGRPFRGIYPIESILESEN
ncbi:MAG: hypothetical protein LBH01_01135 [Verrucomicrobiales bacterium]|jgi:hypothetical protein|nr:hypothetical protein [Verrucomicrobiales bacterium]